MDEKEKIDDLIKMLDNGMANGVGHVNVAADGENGDKCDVQTLGCPDCSSNPLACSIPTLHEGLDDKE